MRRPKADWPALRDLLFKRANGCCEVSGRPLDFDTFDLHHRRNKGMGGTTRPDTDLPSNLLALDPIVHNGGPGSVHGGRARAESRGWLIPKLSTEPLHMVPAFVYSFGGWRWCLLAATGERLPLSHYRATSDDL